jgi:hypothetical protein
MQCWHLLRACSHAGSSLAHVVLVPSPNPPNPPSVRPPIAMRYLGAVATGLGVGGGELMKAKCEGFGPYLSNVPCI